MNKKGLKMKKNKEESSRVRKLIRAKAKQCYLSAFRVIQSIQEYADADYIEGMAVVDGVLPIEHGWVEMNGEIIDPTLPDDDLAYFAGLRFKGGLGIAKAFHIPKPDYCEDLPIFYRFGWGGIDSPEFRAACVAAYRHAGNEFMALRYDTWSSKDPCPSGCVLATDIECAKPIPRQGVEHRKNASMAGHCGDQVTA